MDTTRHHLGNMTVRKGRKTTHLRVDVEEALVQITELVRMDAPIGGRNLLIRITTIST